MIQMYKFEGTNGIADTADLRFGGTSSRCFSVAALLLPCVSFDVVDDERQTVYTTARAIARWFHELQVLSAK